MKKKRISQGEQMRPIRSVFELFPYRSAGSLSRHRIVLSDKFELIMPFSVRIQPGTDRFVKGFDRIFPGSCGMLFSVQVLFPAFDPLIVQ